MCFVCLSAQEKLARALEQLNEATHRLKSLQEAQESKDKATQTAQAEVCITTVSNLSHRAAAYAKKHSS